MATYDMSTLRYGDKGQQVKALQKLLNTDCNAGLVVDGDFGSKTKAAVMAVQAEYGLEQDGTPGPKTWPYLVQSLLASYSGSKVTVRGHTSTVWNQHKLTGTYKAHLDGQGCGHCAAAVAACLMGKPITPAEIMAAAVKAWGTPSNWALSGKGIVARLKALGITSAFYTVTSSSQSTVKGKIDAALKKGRPVACCTYGGPFASGLHWVLAVGFDSAGKVIVANSGSNGPVNVVTLATLMRYIKTGGTGADTGWFKSTAGSAGVVIVG